MRRILKGKNKELRCHSMREKFFVGRKKVSTFTKSFEVSVLDLSSQFVVVLVVRGGTALIMSPLMPKDLV